VAQKVDLIVATTDEPITALRRGTSTIPIVMINSTDPVGTGLVASFAHPGGNITGLSNISPDLSGKRLELLKEVLPAISRVAVLWNADARGAVLDYKESEGNPVTFSRRADIAGFAQRNRLPSMYGLNEYVEAGGLLSDGPSTTYNYRRGATYVDKILKGAKPADLPVERPSKFELVINLKTAKAIGLTIPQTLLQRADQVIN
jgi:putative tryptophan/tyrosine transport system substrate-binding protein